MSRNQQKPSERRSLDHYRYEVPNIIDELKLLNPNEYRIYCKYKQLAGDTGISMKSDSALARECGMGIKKVASAKETLSSSFSELGGLPLIYITKRMLSNGKRDSDLVAMADIWMENMAYMTRMRKRRGLAI